MKYLTPTEDYWVIDIETNGLVDPSRVWVMCYENAVTDEKGALTSEESIKEWFASRPKAVFIGHNAVKFDLPVLNKLFGTGVGISRIVDTLILSQLYNPNLEGGHSLDAWAERFKRKKLTHDEWDKFSDEMVTYCFDDVATTKFIYSKLCTVLKRIEFSEKSVEIQHKITSIIKRQQTNGFAFNQQDCIVLRQKILGEIDDLTEKIRERFPPELVLVDTYKRAVNKDGSLSRQYQRHVEKYPVVEGPFDDGTYKVFDYRVFNIGSPPQRVARLMDLGWKPEEFTPKTDKGGGGNPRPTIKGELSPSLSRFVDESGIEEVKLIAQWMALTGRANMLGTWLDEYNEETGCIHGQLWPASTLRWRHDHPNTANIPAVRTDKQDKILTGRDGYYTYESRALWVPRAPGRVLVGTDAKALEYRMLAHHVNNKELTEVVLSRDVHQFTADMAGVGHDRGAGKTLNFAIIYGAGDAKAGSIVGGKAAAGKDLKEKLFANIPGLGEAIEEARAEFKRGRVILVDGSRIICPTKHASFNYKLQGGGARIMALAAILLEGHIRRKGLDSLKVGDIHDEWQYDVAEGDADEHAKLAVQAIREAGEELNTNCPMDGESKIGLNWAETH